MDATISVICYKSKTLANGEHPLMLRIAQNGKSTYKSLKISVAAKHWDFERNVPKPNNPNKDLIQKIILKTKLDYQQKILEKKANSEEFTASSLINEQKEEIKAMISTVSPVKLKSKEASIVKESQSKEVTIETDKPEDNAVKAMPFDENEIAIVGLAGRYPKAQDLEEFWDNLFQ